MDEERSEEYQEGYTNGYDDGRAVTIKDLHTKSMIMEPEKFVEYIGKLWFDLDI